MKIYKLSHHETPTEIYIGKTTLTLQRRLVLHKAATNCKTRKLSSVNYWIKSLSSDPIIEEVYSIGQFLDPTKVEKFFIKYYKRLYKSRNSQCGSIKTTITDKESRNAYQREYQSKTYSDKKDKANAKRREKYTPKKSTEAQKQYAKDYYIKNKPNKQSK